MNWIGELLRRLRFRLRGARFDADLAEEIRLHLELRTAARQAAGLSPDDAQAAARRQFGNITQLEEASREAWGWRFLDTLAQDVRYALRTLAANPGFTATAVLSLALGIGANTAIFSIINAVMLRYLPVEDPGQLVQFKMGAGGDGAFTNPIWEQVRDHQQAFSGVLAYAPETFDLADGGERHAAPGISVSGNFFRVLGVPALEGRVFTPEDDRHGGGSAGPVAVISYGFWQRHFAGDSAVIGKTLRLNRQLFRVVGVTPPWFTGLDVDAHYDVAVPIGCKPLFQGGREIVLEGRSIWWLRMLGRLSPDIGIKQAEERMRAVAPEIFRATVPQDFDAAAQKEYRSTSFMLLPAGTGFSDTAGSYRTALWTLQAIVGLVLLVACANIGNLLLGRAGARARELSVRMAIGAGRARLVRQLMTESLILAIGGAACGLLLAWWGSRLLVALMSTTRSPLELDLSPDIHVLGFTMGLAFLTTLLFGLAPAIRATRIGLNQILKQHGYGSRPGSPRLSLGKALVCLQVALSLMLVVGAGLFLGTLRNLLSVDPGFHPQRVLLVRADLRQSSMASPQILRTHAAMLDRLRAVPGVVSAASSMRTPISFGGWAQMAYPEGFVSASGEAPLLFLDRVSPGYFRTIRTPLLSGRDFSPQDNAQSPGVMILNESAARQFFGRVDAIGKTVALDKMGNPGVKDTYRVIGVVKDTNYYTIGEAPRGIGYVAAAQDQDPWLVRNFLIRTTGPDDAWMPAVHRALTGVVPGASLEFRNLETQVEESLRQPRVIALLSAIFGGLALLLAMIGLYGVTAYAVARRKSEIGIRVALGARPRSVIWLMLRDVLALLGAGMLLGLAGALAAGRLVMSLLYGVRPNDPKQLAGAAILLAAATAIAAFVPARRAARLDPMDALREE